MWTKGDHSKKNKDILWEQLYVKTENSSREIFVIADMNARVARNQEEGDTQHR